MNMKAALLRHDSSEEVTAQDESTGVVDMSVKDPSNTTLKVVQWVRLRSVPTTKSSNPPTLVLDTGARAKIARSFRSHIVPDRL